MNRSKLIVRDNEGFRKFLLRISHIELVIEYALKLKVVNLRCNRSYCVASRIIRILFHVDAVLARISHFEYTN